MRNAMLSKLVPGVVAILLVAMCLWSAQETEPCATDWGVDLQESPVTLKAFPRSYVIKNNTAKSIVAYRLVCISGKKDKWRIIHRLPLKNREIGPGGTLSSGTFHGLPDVIIQCVKKRKTKVAVSEVRFADGTRWEATREGLKEEENR